MRGYERNLNIYLMTSYIVISPHEGLWAGIGIWQSGINDVISPHEGLWGELKSGLIPVSFVISPHEGLWESSYWFYSELYQVISPHEGLWDLASSARAWAVKVISPHEGLWVLQKKLWNLWAVGLFLPMRGYECGDSGAVRAWKLVISPHEGLWDIWYVSISHYLGSYFSPWGVMSASK